MKILLLGKNGQVGWELNRSLMTLGTIVTLDRSQCDLSRPESIPGIVRAVKPDVIVNAAAYTAVDKAEADEELATTINGVSAGVLADEARNSGSLLIHYSTDYVFDGSKQDAYTESDIPGPANAYGRSKLAGEVAVARSGCDNLVLRTTWVYAARGMNFLRTMLKLAQEHEELRIVADQYGAPTWARNIADATSHILVAAQQRRRAGNFVSNLYHLCASGTTTWHGFSSAIIEYAREIDAVDNIRTESVLPISTEDYPLPATRPRNSRMDSACLMADFGLVLPAWDEAMKLCLEEVRETR